MYGSKWPFYSFLSVCGSGVVSVKCWDRLCILGRASSSKETLPDFHEWCRVTRHPRIFRGLIGCQWTTGKWGITTTIYQRVVHRIIYQSMSTNIYISEGCPQVK